MESLLNLAWVVLAALMFCLWLRSAPGTGGDRRMQLVALAVLLVILFPVISVTDDLLVALNPAETDNSLRRDHACSTPHSVPPPVAEVPQPAFDEVSSGSRRVSSASGLATPVFAHPGIASIQNRPPPTA